MKRQQHDYATLQTSATTAASCRSSINAHLNTAIIRNASHATELETYMPEQQTCIALTFPGPGNDGALVMHAHEQQRPLFGRRSKSASTPHDIPTRIMVTQAIAVETLHNSDAWGCRQGKVAKDSDTVCTVKRTHSRKGTLIQQEI
eukprot:351928-Chlamydomonas_euryale.AAC.2